MIGRMSSIRRVVPMYRYVIVAVVATAASGFVVSGRTVASAQDPIRLPQDDAPPDATPTQVLEGSQSGRITNVVFSPDGASLAAGTDEACVFVWDTRTGKEKLCLTQVRDAGCSSLTLVGYSADGKSLVLVGRRSAFVVNASTGETLAKTTFRSGLIAGEMSPDCSCVAVSDSESGVHVLPVANLDRKKTLASLKADVEVIAFSPDSARVAVSFGDFYPDSVKVFDCKSGRAVWESESIGAPVKAVGFSHDAKVVLALESGGRLRFLDADTGKPLEFGRERVSRIEVGSGGASRIDTTKDGGIASLYFPARHIRTIVDLAEPRVIERSEGVGARDLQSGRGAVAVSRGDGFVVTTEDGKRADAFVRVYSPDRRTIVLEAPLPDGEVRGLTVAADGTKCAVTKEHAVLLVRLSVEQQRQAKQAEADRMVAQRKAAEEAKTKADEAALQRQMAEQKARQEEVRRRNLAPSWGRDADLNEAVERSGLTFSKFVRFGTSAVARKAEGDRFDRMEAEKDAAVHARGMSEKIFLWTAASFKCLDEDVPSDDPEVVKQIIFVDVPFRVDDLQPPLGPHVSVWDSAGSNGLWYLKTDRTLAPIDSGSALVAVERNNGVVYVPDTETSRLRICVAGPLEEIKNLVRNSKHYVVQFQVTEVGTKKTLHWGYYQRAAAPAFGWHTPAMRRKQLAKEAPDAGGGAEARDPPIYFLTNVFPDTPEVVVGSITRIEVARIDGEAREVLFSIEADAGGGR